MTSSLAACVWYLKTMTMTDTVILRVQMETDGNIGVDAIGAGELL